MRKIKIIRMMKRELVNLRDATVNVENTYVIIFKKTEKTVRNFALFSFLSYSEVRFML